MGDVKFFMHFTLVNLAISVLGFLWTESDENGFVSSDSGQKKRLVIDTDAGSDDGVAILNILGAEELFRNLEVQLITTVSGNTHVDNVARNVLKILKTMNRLDIPVYKGSNQSILMTPETENFFGEDGFGDIDFPDPPSEKLIKKEHAANALIEMATLYPGQLILVCLGPLTNIALATRLDPKLFKKMKKIYILGGSDSGIGNVKPGIEFNFYIDPEAASIVLREAEENNKIINLITWETAFVRSKIKMEWRKNVLGIVKSPQVELINKAENLIGEYWISSDAILSAIIIDSKVAEFSGIYHATVETCGEFSRAGLFIDYSQSTNLTKNIQIIKKINTDRFKKMLLQNLNPKGGQTNRASSL